MSKRKSIPTESIPTKSSKKLKVVKSNENDDLAFVWAWAIINISNYWVFNCDSGCFSEICRKEVCAKGKYIAIYQPTKAMIDCEDFIAAIIIKRTDKQPITEKMFNDAKPYLNKVQNLFLESYNNILEITNNKWITKTDGTFDSIIQSKEKLHLVDGSLKLKFKIRGAINHCCGDKWNPHKLIKWFNNTDTKKMEKEELEDYTVDALPAKLIL